MPIVVHEQNARPGLANRLGAMLTSHVAVTFPGTPLRGAQLVGLPLRRLVTQLRREDLRAEAMAAFGLDPRARTLFVTGGSLGAQRLNVATTGAAEALADAGIQVIHAAGRGKVIDVQRRDEGAPAYLAFEYLDRMDLAYAAADLVLCRSGAGTVSELAVLGLPAIYVPLPVGNGEQRLNAEPLVAAGGGILVPDAELTPTWIAAVLIPLLHDEPRLQAMSTAARMFGIRDADERLADLVISVARPA
jgi:UDP-N-acetylglucosamine--N-acetylmuramyl-(pentapeptide) pyrophosphoryl-undecaprenol N-acetylglucosamine transferase